MTRRGSEADIGGKMVTTVSDRRHVDPIGGLTMSIVLMLPIILALVMWRSLLATPKLPLDNLYASTSQYIELLIIILAIIRGFRPLSMLGQAPQFVRISLILLMMIAVGSAGISAVNSADALFDSVLWLIHLMFGLSLAWLATHCWPLASPKIWTVFVVMHVVYSMIVIVYVSLIDDPKTFDWLQLGIGVFNVRGIIFYLVPGFCAALGLVISARSSRDYIAAICAATVMMALACWSGSRSAAVSFLIVPIFIMILIPAVRTLKFVAALTISLVFGSALSIIHAAPHPSYGVFWRVVSNEQEISAGRFEIWQKVVREIGNRPFFGHGDQRLFVSMPDIVFIHPHNSILQFALQWGIVGALLFFGLIGWMWLGVLRNARRDPGTYLPALFVGTGLLFISLFDGPLFWPHPIMVGALAAALGLTRRVQDNSGLAAIC